MRPSSFEYFNPTSLDEAVRLLNSHGDDAKVLAGGMSLIPILKLRLASPRVIVDINGIRELEFVKEESGTLRMGALTRHHTLETSPLVRDKVPLLSEVASQVGDPQVRNMGTLGGSLAHADPSADLGTAMLALRAQLTLVGPSGEKRVPIDEFLVDTFTTALKQGEILSEVAVTIPPRKRSGGAYQKLERRAGDFATAAVAVQIALDNNDICSYVGIGLAAVASKNTRASTAEDILVGQRMNEGVIQEAALAASREADPSDDALRGSAGYKRDMVRVYTRRALTTALARAKKNNDDGERGGKNA